LPGYLLQGLTLGISAAVTPGPFLAYLLSQSLKNGGNWQRTLPATMAPLLSDGPIVFLVLIVLTQFPPLFLRWIQGIGGLFLLYLAYGAYKAFRNHETVLTSVPVARQSLWQAAMVILFSFFRQTGPRVNRILIVFSALARLLFGVYQIWNALIS